MTTVYVVALAVFFPVYGVVKADFCYLPALIVVLSPINILSFPEINITQSGLTTSFFLLLSCLQ